MSRLIQFANNAVSRLAANISNVDTTISITPGDGAKFPTLTGGKYFMATLAKSDGTLEIVKVTGRTTDTLTVVRAAEPIAGTQTAHSFLAGDRIELRLTAGGVGGEFDRLDAAAFIGVANKTANYTITENDRTSLIRVDSTSGNITVTLPQISTLSDDFDVLVTKISDDTNIVAITRAGSDTINGSAVFNLTAKWGGAWLVADRSTNTWTVIATATGINDTVIDTFIGSGTPGPFTLSGEPGTRNNTAVYVGGVYQQKSTYTVSGNSLTLGGNVASGVSVEVAWSRPLPVGTVSASQTVYTPLGTGAVATDVQSKLREFVSVKDFGAVGDGVMDDTAAIQNALTYSGSNGYVCHFPPGRYKTTSALTYSGTGGIDMESCGYGASLDSGIFPSGTGFTALTIGGSPKVCNVTLGGNGQALNGLLIQNPSIAHFGKIRVYDFVGFGVKINKCWDCLFDTISVELCGTTSEYAFSMNDDGDTCNMTTISRLQVEQANGGAILISPNTLSCNIVGIHSERATPSALLDTWVLGGNRCTYTNARFNSIGTVADSKLKLSGSVTTYTNLFSEGAIPVVWDATNAATSLTLLNAEITGTLTPVGGTVGIMEIFGGHIGTLAGSLSKYLQFNQQPQSFTPTLIGTTSAGAGTYTIQTGNYQLVGRMVTFTIALSWTAHTGTGNMRITGLPKISFPGSNYPITSIVSENLTYTGVLGGYVIPSDTTIEIKGYSAAAAGVTLALDTTGSIFLTGSYFI